MRRMRKTAAVLVAMMCVGSMVGRAQEKGDLQKALMGRAEALWDGVERGDGAALQALATPDFVFVGKEGILSFQELGAALQACKMRSYKLHDAEVRQLRPDAAVLVYKADQDFACNGRPDPSQLNVTDTFVREGGTWKIAVHTEAVPSDSAQVIPASK